MSQLKMEKIDHPDDPMRCWGSSNAGQCAHKRILPSQFCPMHGGGAAHRQLLKDEKRMYKLQQWQARAKDFSLAESVKDLRQEIGIIRFSLEEVLASCTNQNELRVRLPEVIGLTNTVKALVEAAQKLEEKGNLLLDKKIVLSVADGLLRVISEHIKDPNILAKLAVEIPSVIEAAACGTPDARPSAAQYTVTQPVG